VCLFFGSTLALYSIEVCAATWREVCLLPAVVWRDGSQYAQRVRTVSQLQVSKEISSLPRLMAMTILLTDLLLAGRVPAQSVPISADHPWHGSAEVRMKEDIGRVGDSRFAVDQLGTYSLSELIDLAEAHNPATRAAWERARSQAAGLGISRSELYPTLAAAALSQTESVQAFFGDRFHGQTIQSFELALDLNYTVFDFGARSGRIDAARARLLSANFAFNDTHRSVIDQVEKAYYRLLNSIGQEDSAQASLSNAKAVEQSAQDRLSNGLATLPDLLEARSATAEAEYDLQSALGAEEIARGDLATAVGTSATVAIKVQPLDQLPTPDSISETVEETINRAFGQRPDLMQQAAEIRTANARLKEARAAYYPALNVNVSPALPSLYGIQQPFHWSHTSDLTGSLSFGLNWTVFDGGARKSRVAQAQADIRAAEAQTSLKKNQIADEVWTAYSNLNTSFRQHRAAVALLEAANQSYNAALESYKYGLRNLLDVTAAQRSLAQARSADVLARTQVLAALADLAFTTGDSIQSNRGRSHP
jgi:outer membrane protein